MADERIYVVPLSDAKSTVRYKRTPNAMRILKTFVSKHMKSENIKIENSVNEKLWKRGIKNPPTKIRVKATKQEDGSVVVSLAE